MFGICNLAIVPLRMEPSDRSEMTSQVLFGEHFKILEQNQKWSRIELAYDNYTGWIDNKQFRTISETDYTTLIQCPLYLNADLIEYITTQNNQLLPVPIGASLSFLDHSGINIENFSFEGLNATGITGKQHCCALLLFTLMLPISGEVKHLLASTVRALHKWCIS